MGWVELVGFNVGLKLRSGLGLMPKDAIDREICHHNFVLSRREWLPRFGTPMGKIWMGT